MPAKFIQLLACCFLLSLLAACSSSQVSSTNSKDHSYAPSPCWLHTPYSDQTQGVIAITAEFGSGDTKELSRRQAVASLAEVFNLSTRSLDDLDVDQNQLTLGGRSIGIAPTWTHQGQHISYAYLANAQADRWVRTSCQQPRCQPESCSPEWLCEENKGQYLSAVTVSQLAATQREQYRFLFKNALAQLRTTHGVRVEASRAQLHTTSGSALNLSNYLRERQQSSFEFNDKDFSASLVLSDSCRYDTTLYGRLQLKGASNPHADLLPVDKNWHLNLASPGEGMAIGHFSGMLSHNLISLRIEYALRAALLELARTQNVQISSDQLQVESLEGGYYSMQFISEETQMSMKVRVRGVRFLGNSDDPDVYVLVEGI